MNDYNLKELPLNQSAYIKEINECPIKRRLLDLGFSNRTLIKKVLRNISKNMCAYQIRNTTIAIRDDDAEKVLLEVN